MAKKIRLKVEQALYDIKVARKMIKKAAQDLEDSIDSRDNKIAWLEKEAECDHDWTLQVKEQCDSKLQDVIGSHVDTYIKGYNFEKFVVKWMYHNYNEFDLKIWQGDKCVDAQDGKRIVASWNMYPDLIYVNEGKKQVIALECKYRNDGVLKLSKKKFEDYIRFEEQIENLMNVDVKVYIMLGCGPDSSKPDSMYRIPISALKGIFETEDTCIENAECFSQYRVKLQDKQAQQRNSDLPF